MGWYYLGFVVMCLVTWWWHLARAIDDISNGRPYKASYRLLMVLLLSVIISSELVWWHNVAINSKASTVPTKPIPKDEGPEVREPSVFPI